MDVRAKQRLYYRVAWLLSAGLVVVSPHVISAVRCFRVKSTVEILLQNMDGVLAENTDYFDEAKFIALALAEFPSLADEFAENEGLFHVQMGVFSRIARTAIERGDFATLKRCYNLADETMKNASPGVENAIFVSFLENLNFEILPYGAEARRLLPPKLSQMLVELEEHFQMLWKSQQAREAEEQDANS